MHRKFLQGCPVFLCRGIPSVFCGVAQGLLCCTPQRKESRKHSKLREAPLSMSQLQSDSKPLFFAVAQLSDSAHPKVLDKMVHRQQYKPLKALQINSKAQYYKHTTSSLRLQVIPFCLRNEVKTSWNMSTLESRQRNVQNLSFYPWLLAFR